MKDEKKVIRSRGKGVAASTKPNNETVSTDNKTNHQPRGKAVGSTGKPNS